MKVYLDLDGVLADFIGGLCRLFGVDRAYFDARQPPGQWDCHEVFGLTEDAMWAEVDAGNRARAFWEDLDWTPGGKMLLSAVERVAGRDNVTIMTKPPRNPDATAGKVAWIRRELPRYRRRFAVTPCKEELAHPGAVLIDDSDENVEKFRAAGGHALLVPALWNSLHDHRDVARGVVEQGLRLLLEGSGR